MNCHLVTVIWGKEHTDLFLRLTLRTLLAPGNIDERSADSFRYTIYTTEPDREILLKSRLFRRLQALIPVQIETFSLRQIDPANPVSHWIMWRRAAVEIESRSEALITIAGDHLLSRGTLTRWRKLFAEGKLAIFSPGLQVVRETLEPELRQQFADGEPIDLDVSALHQLMFDHFHPATIAMLAGSRQPSAHPEYHLVPLAGRGMIQSIRTSHAVAFVPGAIKTNQYFCPIEKFDQIAFEPCRFLSAEPYFKAASNYLLHSHATDETVSHLGNWLDEYMMPVNQMEAEHPHVYACNPPLSDGNLAAGRHAIAFQHRQLLLSRTLFRIWRMLHQRGRPYAARWIAAAALRGRLRRRITVGSQATIFIPAESSLARCPPETGLGLMAHRASMLDDAALCHIAKGHHQLRIGQRLDYFHDGAIEMADGQHLDLSSDGRFKVVGGIENIDAVRIYFIDRILYPLSLAPMRQSNAARQILNQCNHSISFAKYQFKRSLIHILQQSPKLFLTVQRVRNRLAQRTRIPHDPPPQSGLTALRDAITARAITTSRAMLDFYSVTVLGRPSKVSETPVLGTGRDRGPAAVVALQRALDAEPDFAEAWLELAYHEKNSGDHSLARNALRKCLETHLRLPRGPTDPHAHVIASIELAEYLINEGKYQEADELLQTVPMHQPYPWCGHMLRADLQVRLSNHEEALSALDDAMNPDNVLPGYAALLPGHLNEPFADD